MGHSLAYRHDVHVDNPVRPEPVRPRSLRRHHGRVFPRRLRLKLLLRQRTAVVFGRLLPGEPRTMRRRVELRRLLEDGWLRRGGMRLPREAPRRGEGPCRGQPERRPRCENRSDGRPHSRGLLDDEVLLVWCGPVGAPGAGVSILMNNGATPNLPASGSFHPSPWREKSSSCHRRWVAGSGSLFT